MSPVLVITEQNRKPQAEGTSSDDRMDTDAAEDLYTDRQCRHILLQPFGERWKAELAVVRAALVEGSDMKGALILI